MSVDVIIHLMKKVDDSDKAHDFIEEIVELLQGKIKCTMHSQESNHNPKLELEKES